MLARGEGLFFSELCRSRLLVRQRRGQEMVLERSALCDALRRLRGYSLGAARFLDILVFTSAGL
jgi:hypothetical protein